MCYYERLISTCINKFAISGSQAFSIVLLYIVSNHKQWSSDWTAWRHDLLSQKKNCRRTLWWFMCNIIFMSYIIYKLAFQRCSFFWHDFRMLCVLFHHLAHHQLFCHPPWTVTGPFDTSKSANSLETTVPCLQFSKYFFCPQIPKIFIVWYHWQAFNKAKTTHDLPAML